MSKKYVFSKLIAVSSAATLIFGALGTGFAANAAKPVDAGKPADVGNAASGKPADAGKPAEAGKPIDVVGKPIELGKPADTGKDFVDVKTDGSTGKPITKEGKATFGNVEKLTAAEKKAAAKAKAEAKKDNGNKVNYIVRFNEAADFGLEMAALKSGKATIGREFQPVHADLSE